MRPLSLCVLSVLAAITFPWWNDYPTTVQTSDPDTALASGATSCLCGIADDPCWGIHGTRCRYLGMGARAHRMRTSGLKLLTWTEAFGTCEQYIAEFEPDGGGGLMGYEADPGTPRPALNHWGWHTWRPIESRARHWIGLPAYYEDEAWVRPWTRTHPRYGARPFRYPDGRAATGAATASDGKRWPRMYDAGCSKSILGDLAITYGRNSRVNELDPKGNVRGPTEGLVAHDTTQGVRYSGCISFGKDSACPHWIDYARASARQLVDFGVEGLWADNFSAWDSMGNPPLRTAFGDWSVHRFRKHLEASFTPERLRRLGVGNLETFDVREYLRRFIRETLGGNDESLSDPKWRDPRWLDDPIWREYVIFKARIGREALQRYHDMFHEAALSAGVRDFVIQGNDIPIWSFGMPRPESLEMVSTEYSPGWNLLGGPRGMGLPPSGRISPIIKMARVHQRGRFVHLWYYLDGEYERYRGTAAVGRLLSYELLANHAMLQAQPSQAKVAGTPESHREVYRFIAACKGKWGDRLPIARIGLVYSPESQLASLTPAGPVEFGAQRHAFDLLGWGTLLSELHYQYTVLPEWDLTARSLAPLAVLVLPSVAVLTPQVLDEVLEPWVQAGGRLILSGPAGERYGSERSHEAVENPAGMLPELCRLAAVDVSRERAPSGSVIVGSGQVITMPPRGFEYYQQAPAQRELASLKDTVAPLCGEYGIVASSMPRELEVGVFASPSGPKVFVDLANLDMDPDRDKGPRPREVSLRIALPGTASGKLSGTLLQPQQVPRAITVRVQDQEILVEPFTLESYGSVVIDGWRGATSQGGL